jgi:hypothetical protein
MSFPDQRTSSGYVDLDAAMARVRARIDEEARDERERTRRISLAPHDDDASPPRSAARARDGRRLASMTTALAALALVSLGAHAYAFSKVSSHDRALDAVLTERRANTEAKTPKSPTDSSSSKPPVRGTSAEPMATAEALPEPVRPPSARAHDLVPAASREPRHARTSAVAMAPTAPVPATATPIPPAALARSAPEPSGPADLGAAMRAAVAPSEGERPTPMPTTNLARETEPKQLRPAPGAIVAAVRAVQDAARACLAEGDVPRVHTIHFGPDGRVVRVEPGLRDERTACIDRALARAHVDAFSEEGYRARITVRP